MYAGYIAYTLYAVEVVFWWKKVYTHMRVYWWERWPRVKIIHGVDSCNNLSFFPSLCRLWSSHEINVKFNGGNKLSQTFEQFFESLLICSTWKAITGDIRSGQVNAVWGVHNKCQFCFLNKN
jgi:hypothetical protein